MCLRIHTPATVNDEICPVIEKRDFDAGAALYHPSVKLARRSGSTEVNIGHSGRLANTSRVSQTQRPSGGPGSRRDWSVARVPQWNSECE